MAEESEAQNNLPKAAPQKIGIIPFSLFSVQFLSLRTSSKELLDWIFYSFIFL